MKKIIAIVAFLIFAASIYLVSNNKKIEVINSNNKPTPIQTDVILSPVIPGGWQTYIDTKNGYEIAFPSDWNVEESNVAPKNGGYTKYKSASNSFVLTIGFDSNNPQNLSIEEYGYRRLSSQGINSVKSEKVTLSNNLTVFKAIIPQIGEVPVNSKTVYSIYYLFQKDNEVYWAQGYTTDYIQDEVFYDNIMSTISF